MPDILKWEKISLAAWPTLDSFEDDGWVVRTSAGYTKRSNSVSPVRPGRTDIGEKIARCEHHFAAHRLPVLFKMTDAVRPTDLDGILQERGYGKESPTRFMTADLSARPVETSCSVRIEPSVHGPWLEAYSRFNRIAKKDRHTFRRMLTGHPRSMGFLLLTHGNRTVGCGLSILCGNTAGFFDISVDEEERRKGFGREIVQSLIAWARMKKACRGYLQVECDNEPANRMYETLGFTEEYIYWYRRKA